MLGNLAVTEEYLPVAFGNLDHSCELVRARLRGILPRALTALPQKTFNSWTTDQQEVHEACACISEAMHSV